MVCPKCNRQPTGNYRDELRIDGMYCRRCNVAWNVDWENRKPLYETTVDIGKSDLASNFYIDPRDSGEDKEWDNKSDAEQIEEILLEAHGHNLRDEVKGAAIKFMKHDPDLNEAVAFEMAYQEIIK